MEREAAGARPFGQGGQQGQGPAAGMNGGFAACPTFLPKIWPITIAQHARISIFRASLLHVMLQARCPVFGAAAGAGFLPRPVAIGAPEYGAIGIAKRKRDL